MVIDPKIIRLYSDGVGKEQNIGGGPVNKMERRRLLERLELLCTSGVGIEAIAPQICEIFRCLVGADSGSIFWQDEHGRPMGFFHDTAPAEAKDFFVTNFETLFSDPNEINMVSMLQPSPPNIGKSLRPGWLELYRVCNVYTYLSRPLGHEYMLDVRVDDRDGRGRVLLCGWNIAGRPFTPTSVKQAQPVHDFVSQAVNTAHGEIAWRSIGSRTAHCITDIKGKRLIAIDDEAEHILRMGHLLGQNIPMHDELRGAPSFVQSLAKQLDNEPTAEMVIPIASGRLAVRAVRSKLRDNGADTAQIFVSLDMQQAQAVLAIEYLCTLSITMLQKRIALHVMLGGTRQDCENKLGVSPEALKKHLSAIYLAVNVDSWNELAVLKKVLPIAA